jgi:signal transduction histidine kinase
MQSGVELLGFVHDMAEEAAHLSDRAEEASILAKNTDESSLKILRLVTANMSEHAGKIGGIVRSMNRLAEGRRPESTHFDLGEVIAEVNPVIESKSGEVRIIIPSGIYIRGDALDIQRIILNLVANARHWTPRDGRKIEVRASVVGEHVELCVKDNGLGMSERVRREAQNPFYSNRKGGLGLGLYVVKLLANRLRGEVQISSEEYKGTSVRVILPLVKGPNSGARN